MKPKSNRLRYLRQLLFILATLPLSAGSSFAANFVFAVDNYLMANNIEFLSQVRSLMATQGHTVQLQVMPVSQALQLIENGQLDGHALMHPYHAQQRALIQIPTPVQTLPIWAWVTKLDNCPKTAKAFRNKKPIIIKGASHSDMAIASTAKGYRQANDADQAILLLQQNKGDYIFATWDQMSLSSSGSPQELSACGSQPILNVPVFMFIHPRNQALTPILNQAAQNAQ
ncbi:hypothetical protein DBZ36_13410 [Alginatibacterium sediminis]|uniref:Solute-binding protein family 3/N-terminal domain-containing protein n=1 Tax=Alginatibacterium sediminis TaxID=2164068 RepID=A0A420E9U2_9ALTE|nr:hypothetical protein [Alginatibacterium sediminis]RKF17442.1 hypothetical protein DBZ36_13410 [Alginatibacterium sediminis]